MVEQRVPLAAKAVSREFPVIQRQIARTRQLNWQTETTQGLLNALQDKTMGTVDDQQVRVVGQREDDGVHQTTRADHDRRSAATSAKNRNLLPAAGSDLDLLFDPRTSPDDHCDLRRLPKPQQITRRPFLVGAIQQRLIQGQVFGGRRQREF